MSTISMLTLSPGGMRSTAMSMYVCLSVCLLAYLENHTAQLHNFFVNIACGCGSVLLRRRCDSLFTSGFVADVIFACHGDNNQESRTKFRV